MKDEVDRKRNTFNWDNRKPQEWKLSKFSQVGPKVQPPNTKKR